MTTMADIQHHKTAGAWRVLEKLAVEIVNDAAENAKSDFKPVLGGGTRLMLAMAHRISDDIDLFIRDPQWIGYLTPRLNDRSKIAHLVSGRVDEIQAALVAMNMSPKAQLVWDGIRAAELPDLHESVQWAQSRLEEFRRMAVL